MTLDSLRWPKFKLNIGDLWSKEKAIRLKYSRRRQEQPIEGSQTLETIIVIVVYAIICKKDKC